MLLRAEKTRRRAAGVIVMLAMAAIVAVDLAQPAGVVFATAFVAVVVLAFTYLKPRQALAVTLICSLATAGDAYFDRSHENLKEALIERALVLGAILLTAFLVYRRRLVSSLEESEARHQALFDGAADGILTVDLEGTICSVNPAASRMLGYAPGELSGQPLDRIIPLNYREKRSEEAARESESRFRMIADSTPFMIFALGSDRQNTFVNSRLIEFTGRNRDELLGDGLQSLVYSEDVDRVVREYGVAFESWQPFELEYRLRRADGEYRWVVAAGRPRFAPDEDFTGFIGSVMDIHDRKMAEMALRESECGNF